MPVLAYRWRRDGAVLPYSSGLGTWICEVDPFPTYIATFPLAEHPKPSYSTRQNNERQHGEIITQCQESMNRRDVTLSFVGTSAPLSTFERADEDEPQVFGEAKHTARNAAKFRRVCGKRVAGAISSGISSGRPPAAGGNGSNRPSRSHPGADGCCPDPGATAGRKSHVAFRARRKRCSVERARWQNRGRHVSSAGLAEVESSARWAGQCAAEDGDRHALAFRP